MPERRVRTLDQEAIWRKFLALLAKDEPDHPWIKIQEQEDKQKDKLEIKRMSFRRSISE